MVKMDKLDMKILNMLLDNCRESDRQIGKIIGISGGAVKSRIQKMIDQSVSTNTSTRTVVIENFIGTKEFARELIPVIEKELSR